MWWQKFPRDLYFEVHFMIFIHIGYPKCGSTSLQEAFAVNNQIFYPRAGILAGFEHLALALKLKGVDAWTSQFVSNNWVEEQQRLLEISLRASDKTKVLSSERLASLNPSQISDLRQMFPDEDVQIVIVVRDLENYISSTWRHAVFYHDYHVPYQQFRVRMAKFNFESIVPAFSKYFPVHIFNMDEENYSNNLEKLIGAPLTLPKSNVGIPKDLACALQEAHATFGSPLFKRLFTRQVKEEARRIKEHGAVPIDVFDVPLF